MAALGVTCGTEFFPDLKKKTIALKFPYPEGYKARSIESKSFVAGGGFKSAFWNIERVIQAKPPVVYITEGELDACALVEAGVPADSVLSVPNGAKEKPVDHPKEQRGYAYVMDARDAGLDRAIIVWCGDNDGPGHALRADMAAIFGAARFQFVEWPANAKDAGDVLKYAGPGPLNEAIEKAKEWPVTGVFKFSQLPKRPPRELWSPGFPEWKEKVFLAPRTLSVVTGHPGHGKTMLWQQIWYQVIKAYDVVACMASFETEPNPDIQRQLRTLHSGFLERDMDEEQIRAADEWMEDRYIWLIHEDQRPELEWFLDRAATCVIRYGARIIQIDPWNRFEHQRGRDETETEYIGRALREMSVFAKQMNCHVQILAHPAKMDGKYRGQRPGLEDISGSKHWHNMPDQGFVVHRDKIFDDGRRCTEATLFHMKARFADLGYSCDLPLDYVLAKGAFISTVFETKE